MNAMKTTEHVPVFKTHDMQRLKALLGERVTIRSEHIILQVESCSTAQAHEYYCTTPVTKETTGSLQDISRDGVAVVNSSRRTYVPYERLESCQVQPGKDRSITLILKARIVAILHKGETVFLRHSFLKPVMVRAGLLNHSAIRAGTAP